jgi:hypothetical protein
VGVGGKGGGGDSWAARRRWRHLDHRRWVGLKGWRYRGEDNERRRLEVGGGHDPRGMHEVEEGAGHVLG